MLSSRLTLGGTVFSCQTGLSTKPGVGLFQSDSPDDIANDADGIFTDMDGLCAVFDTNGGSVDNREFLKLAQLTIQWMSLTPTSSMTTSFTDGSQIYGTRSFGLADGRTGIAADAALAYRMN